MMDGMSWGGPPPPPPPPPPGGTQDGAGASDKDEPYRWGRTPRWDAPGIFTPFQVMRLMFLRGRVQDRKIDRHIQPPDPDGL